MPPPPPAPRKKHTPYERVLIYSWGTRGDVQPPLSLALRLKDLGKEVTMFVTPPADEMVRKAGITCVSAKENGAGMFDALGALDMSDASLRNTLAQLRALKEYESSAEHQAVVEADTKAGYELAVAFQPDVILHAGFAYAFWASVGEALGVPVVRYDLQPNYPTSEIGFFKKPNGSIPKCLNKLSYTLYNRSAISKAQMPRAMALRELAGLPAATHRDGSPLVLPPDLPELCAMSPSFIPQPTDWPEYKEMVGYWTMKPDQHFAPPKELRNFLQGGTPPAFIGFGSMKGNPAFCKRLSTMAIAALARAKLRGVLLGGWAGLTAEVLDTATEQGAALAAYARAYIFELPSCPHDWLFPRCSAVVHHGGAGTTAAGLIAGRPTIICSVSSDQPWHGSLIAQKQLGAYAGPVGTVSGEALGALLVKVLADPLIAEQVADVSTRLAAEDGPLNTHKAIEHAIDTFPYPWPTKK